MKSSSNLIYCDNTIAHPNEPNILAKRICTKCKMSLCDSCVIDDHGSHIEFARVKIDKVDNNLLLNDVNNFCQKSENTLQNTSLAKTLNKLSGNYTKRLEESISSNRRIIDGLMNKLMEVMEIDEEMVKEIERFVRETGDGNLAYKKVAESKFIVIYIYYIYYIYIY